MTHIASITIHTCKWKVTRSIMDKEFSVPSFELLMLCTFAQVFICKICKYLGMYHTFILEIGYISRNAFSDTIL